MSSSADTNQLTHALSRLAGAQKIAKIHEEVIERLQRPEAVLTVSIPVRMDDGSLKIFEGYRVRHNTLRGPGKGGLRYHPATDLDEVNTLAFWMTCKLLELDVDILIPAAMEDVITSKNVSRVKAKTILELANGPLTAEADDALAKKGTVVIPDILANAGGVTVSYYEWVQNLSGDYWEEEEITTRLEKRMRKQFRNVQNLAEEHSTTLRTAAYALALQRIGDVVNALGTSRYFAQQS